MRSAAATDPSPSSTPEDAASLVALGHRLSEARALVEAEGCFRRAIALSPALPMAHNNLGWVRWMQGDAEGAIAGFERALALNPSLGLARANLAALYAELGRASEAMPLWHALVAEAPDDRKLLNTVIGHALRAGEPARAAAYAERLAALNRGSRWYPAPEARVPPPATPVPAPVLTAPKLRHDLEQLRYLRARGVLGGELDAAIEGHARVLEKVLALGDGARVPLDADDRDLVGDVYGRIVHLRATPEARGRALSGRWAGASVEDAYLGHPLGIAVVDDFLSEEALEGVRRFCLESTVWFTNRYAHGRLGAFFREGFNCPLLLQIADELRRALPRVIGDRHPLLQLWAFKNDHVQPPTSAHADFAAVNVNFWITPDDANLDRETGGLVIYDVEAPRDWAFRSYNRDGARIGALLRERRARAITIPYRANRVVVFNADLFHATAPLQFRVGYENRRINVTMLYGRREAGWSSEGVERR